MRVSIASASPPIRAARWRCGGRFPTRIEMKMMLSTPRTISSSASAMNASQVCGSAISASSSRYGR
jgi:hypothetical protein